MNIKITKEAFGPYRITATLAIDPKAKRENGITQQDYYLALGALYEMERKPASAAEKLFWNADKRPGDFTRSKDIPTSPEAAARIREVMETAGYSEVAVEVRDVKESGPAWKTKVSALVGLPDLDDEITPKQVHAMIGKLAEKLNLDLAEVMAYAVSKGLK